MDPNIYQLFQPLKFNLNLEFDNYFNNVDNLVCFGVGNVKG